MEQKQRFSIRKFKTAVGSALLASFLLGSPILQAVNVLAQNTETVTTTQQELANATNLKDQKATYSDLIKAMEANAGTSTGELLHSVSSKELDEAVKVAEAAGVTITNEDVAKYDSLEAAQEDYVTQIEAVESITKKQLVATEAYKAATVKYKEYLAAETAYQQDKSKYEAYQAAKAEYDTAFATYETAYQAYEKALADNVKALAEYEKEKIAYDKAYSLYQDKLAKYTDVTQSNEAKRQAYDTALSQYQKDYAAYQAALSTYQAAQATDTASQTKYQADLEKFNKLNEKYKKDLAAHQKLLDEARQRTGMDGYLPTIEVQNLSLRHSRNPKVVLSNLKGISFDTNTYQKTEDHIKYLFKYGELTNNPEEAYSRQYDPYNGDNLGGSYHLHATSERFSFTATYSNVEGITHNGKEVSKVVYDVSGYSSIPMNVIAYEDPVDFFEWAVEANVEIELSAQPKYYDKDGNRIPLVGNSLFYMESLENNIHGNRAIEKVTGRGGDFLTINGSSIQKHGSDYYSINDNWTDKPGGEWNWSRSIVFKPTDEDFLLTFKKSPGINGNYIWVGMQTSLKINDVPKAPVAPVPPIPPVPTATDNTPEEPTPPTEPTYETVEQPTPPVEPTRPNIIEPEKPSEPTPPNKIEKPSEPDKVPEPVEPSPLKITVHKNVYATQPQPVKGVTNEAGEDVANGLVPKGATVKFPVSIPALKANREETGTFVIEDIIDEGIELDLEAVKESYKHFDVTYGEDRRLIITPTKDYLAAMNKDLTKDFEIETPDIVGRVLNDGATYINTIKVTINDYVAHTNTVKVTTPGKPNDPDHPTNNLIEPAKTVLNEQGEAIDGKGILRGDKLIYPNLWDLDQFATIKNGDKVKQIHIFIEDIDGTKVTPDLKNLTFEDKAKEAVKTPIMVTHVESLDKADKSLKELIVAAGLADKIDGDFVAMVPEDMAAFEEQYVKTGNSISFNLMLTPKDDATGVVKNTSYQISYGNGYQTKTVTNPIKVTTEWADKTSDKALKDKVTGDKTEDKGEFPNYRFVETVPTKTGIKHLFERLYTTEWEEEGTKKVLKDKVTDTKTHEKGEFDGMTFVKTVDTETGIKHIFTKAKTPEKKSTTAPNKKQYTTEWVEEGTNKSLKDKVTGDKTLEAGQIDDYEYVRSEPTATGVKHIFKKVTKPVEQPAEKPSTPVKKTPLPSTGEQVTAAIGYLGAVLIGLAIAWKTGLLKRLKNQLKK